MTTNAELLNNLNESRTPLKFVLTQVVRMKESEESGTVIGVGIFLTSEPQYQVRYRAGDGRQTEAWFGESAITA